MPFRGTRWSRSAETVLSASRTPRSQLLDNAAGRALFKTTHARPYGHESRVKAKRLMWLAKSSRIPTTGKRPTEPNVDPDSLRNTLEAHREANRSSLIVKIAGKGSVRQHIDPSLRIYRNAEPTSRDDAVGTGTRHIKLARGRGRRRRLDNTLRPLYAKVFFLPQWAPSSELRYGEKYPWMKRVSPHALPELDGRPAGIAELSKEIDAFYSYLQPSAQENQAAELALREITTAIQKVDESIKIDVVGSRATGLALSMSDIDLNISNFSAISSREAIKDLLNNVASCLVAESRGKSLFRSVSTRFRAKVPLVAGRHASTHLEFQVQSSVDVFLSMQQTISFINEFPTLPKLFVLLKQMLTMRGLNIGPMQGITSYPLIVMIVAALKFSEGRLDRRDVGGQLLFFLDMYSEIDFTTTAISFSPLQYVVKRHPHSATLPNTRSAAPTPDTAAVSGVDPKYEPQDVDARRRFATIKPDAEFLMCLQDPADLHNDLGKSALRIRDIQNVFTSSREELKTALRAWDDGGGHSRSDPLLAPCIGGDYRIFENARHRLATSVSRI